MLYKNSLSYEKSFLNFHVLFPQLHGPRPLPQNSKKVTVYRFLIMRGVSLKHMRGKSKALLFVCGCSGLLIKYTVPYKISIELLWLTPLGTSYL